MYESTTTGLRLLCLVDGNLKSSILVDRVKYTSSGHMTGGQLIEDRLTVTYSTRQ